MIDKAKINELEKISFAILNGEEIKNCGLESEEILNYFKKYDSVEMILYKIRLPKIFQCKLIKFNAKKLEIELHSREVVFALKVLFGEFTSDNIIYFHDVTELNRILPVCMVENSNKKNIATRLRRLETVCKKHELKVLMKHAQYLKFNGVSPMIKNRFPLSDNEKNYYQKINRLHLSNF